VTRLVKTGVLSTVDIQAALGVLDRYRGNAGPYQNAWDSEDRDRVRQLVVAEASLDARVRSGQDPGLLRLAPFERSPEAALAALEEELLSLTVDQRFASYLGNSALQDLEPDVIGKELVRVISDQLSTHGCDKALTFPAAPALEKRTVERFVSLPLEGEL
jgi:hypothetical protein